MRSRNRQVRDHHLNLGSERDPDEPGSVSFVLHDDAPDQPEAGRASAHLGRTVILNLALTVVGLVAAGLVPFGFNLAVGRTYGPSILGPIAVALSLALFLGQIPGTIAGAATKFIAESLGRGDEQRACQVFRFLLMVTAAFSFLIGVAIVALAPLIQPAYKISFNVVLLSASLVPSYTLYLYFKSCYYGFQRVRTYLTNEIVSDAAFFGVLAAVFILGATPWLLLPFVVNNVIFSAIALKHLWPYLSASNRIDRRDRREVLTYCLINGSGSAASLGRWSLAAVVAGLFLSHHAVGLLAAALALTAPLALLPRAISLVTFALMARLHGAGEASSVRMVLQQSTEWLVFLLGIPSGLAMINASAALQFGFGSEFAKGALATQLIIAGAYLTDISRPSIDALSSTRYVRTATVASFLGLASSLFIWLVFIPSNGIAAAGLGFAVGALVTAAIPAYYACKHIGSRPIVFVRPLIMVCGLAGLIAFAPQCPIGASIVFTGVVLILYVHLLEALIRALSQSLRHGRLLPEESR